MSRFVWLRLRSSKRSVILNASEIARFEEHFTNGHKPPTEDAWPSAPVRGRYYKVFVKGKIEPSYETEDPFPNCASSSQFASYLSGHGEV